jgi:RNA polymerase sigma-70 factor (ECF subfamily)
MRALSERLHEQLMRSTQTDSFQRNFTALCHTEEVISFPEPQALIAHLHGRNGDPEEKNSILAALIRAAQGKPPLKETAGTLLWLALWPGLDALHRRLARYFWHDPEDLVSRIAARLTREIATLDLARVSRVAATMLMNIERDIKRGLAVERRERQAAGQAAKDIRDTIQAPDDAEDLARLLSRLSASDANLVMAVVIRGETQGEAAKRLGLSHDAARKRLQRALRRIAPALENFFGTPCPTCPAKTAFTHQTFPKKGPAQ